MDNTPYIQIRKLKKSFGEQIVLDGIDLEIDENQITAIIGKSGIGKSVLLKCLAGLMEPDSGEILFEGKDINHPAEARPRRHFRQRLSYMFQNNALFDSMTIEQNIGLPLVEKSSLAAGEIRERVQEMIEKLDLRSDIGKSFPSQISGGMQKRVALARALITEPDVVLFDEPTTGLDPVRKNVVYEMIQRYRERFGFTALLVSHDIPDVLCISDKLAILNKGQIQFYGTPLSLRNSRPPFKMSTPCEEAFGVNDPFKERILSYLV